MVRLSHVNFVCCLFYVIGALLNSACSEASILQPFHFTSQTFVDSTSLAKAQIYTAAGGGNVSPELHWTGAPRGTKYFILIVFDPDAREGKGWWHWFQTEIPASTHDVQLNLSNLVKDGADRTKGWREQYGSSGIRNSFGDYGYDGPFPPIGDLPHHYIFTLYAMPNSAHLSASQSDPLMITAYVKTHALGHAELTGLYGR